jgi:hypothetical protein
VPDGTRRGVGPVAHPLQGHPRGEQWRIDGEKIFISGGDQDLSEDILHLVLARTSDDGLKGLSLFAATRSAAGDRIKVARIEEKMGLHASPTCQMLFDGAPAELIGNAGAGLKAMFTMMNHAGPMSHFRAWPTRQGLGRRPPLCRRSGTGAGPDGAPVTLAHHADVARMIDGWIRWRWCARALRICALVTMERGDEPRSG